MRFLPILLAAVFTLPAASAPPTLTSASVLPNTEFVQLLAADPDNNLSRAYFVINTAPAVQLNGCHGFYDYAQQRVYLYDDSLTVFVDENSRCAIDRTQPVRSPNGEVILPLVRRGSMPATKVYLWITDTANLGTGWLDPGLNLPQRTQQTPIISKGTPASINSVSQQFSAQIEDLDGRFDLYRIYFLIDPTGFSIPQNTCHGFYDIATQTTYLYNDALTAFAPNLENSQCAISAVTAAPTSTTTIQLTFTATRKGAYIGADLGIYLWAVDYANNGTGWQRTSSWIDSPNSPPRVLSAVRLLTGNPLTISAAVTDRDGVSDLRRIYFLLAKNPVINTGGCHGFVDLAQNAVFLYNDDLTAFAPNLENSQCSINGLGRISTAGSFLDWTTRVTRRGAYKTGDLNMYFWAVDNAGTGTGWVPDFIWSLAPTQQPPALPSISPTTTANATETFSLYATDANGANDISRVYFLLNTNTTIPQNTCHGFYDLPTNAIYLYNDALTALLGPLTLGTTGKLQNAQCAIDGLASSANASGTLLALNLNLTRQGAYSTGVKDLYFWVVDSANTGTGWVRGATWTR